MHCPSISFYRRRLAGAATALTLLLNLAAGVAPAAAADRYLDPDAAFRGSARVADGRSLEIAFDIAPGYHLYRERLQLKAEAGGTLRETPSLPPGRAVHDENFGRTMQVYEGRLQWPVSFTPDASQATLRVQYQGCADQGLCYPPQVALVQLRAEGGRLVEARWQPEGDTLGNPSAGSGTAAVAPTSPAPGSATPAPATAGAAGTAGNTTASGGSGGGTATAVVAVPTRDEGGLGGVLRSRNWGAIAAAFALAGLLLSFTPCVLPMVPILSSIIVGQSGPVTRSRGFSLALSYALGMALVYTALGVAAGLAGEGLAAALQNPWVLGAFATLLVVLALAMFDVFQLQMPSSVQTRLVELSSRLPAGRFAGVFLMGGLSALIVGPCVAAPLAGALVFISQTRDVAIGALALFSLAMGMSVPLLLVGLSAGSLLPRAGAWMEHVKTVFGAMLLAVALWLVSPVLPARVTMLLAGAGLLMAAAQMRLLDRLPSPVPTRHRMAQGIGLLLAVLGVAQVVGALSGGDDPTQPLSHLTQVREAGASTTRPVGTGFQRVRSAEDLDRVLRSADRPVMLDFYADWCVSCKEMEHLTFRDPQVRSRLDRALLLQVDVTANTEADKALLRRFELFGPPAVLLFDPARPQEAVARVVGYTPPREFERVLGGAGL